MYLFLWQSFYCFDYSSFVVKFENTVRLPMFFFFFKTVFSDESLAFYISFNRFVNFSESNEGRWELDGDYSDCR